MIWTTKKPTKVGWYWYRNDEGSVWIERVVRRNRRLALEGTAGYIYLSTRYPGQWAGPIPEPTEGLTCPPMLE